MPVVKTMSVTYGRKLNLGDYNSVHSEVTLWVDLEEGDNEEQVALAVRDMARNNVANELGRLVPALKAKTESLFMGLPAEIQEMITEEENAD